MRGRSGRSGCAEADMREEDAAGGERRALQICLFLQDPPPDGFNASSHVCEGPGTLNLVHFAEAEEEEEEEERR
ncbi:hypothetical protein EXN66_Car012066 [Channa argus]|uniref:Uncharacterized protein n=1 Tax=Channa argus TaxID=215402 RepID=A0A6G1Q1P7_CHAAH|nr:hypothetical protein EXN66_Car012066 [Channa argus]